MLTHKKIGRYEVVSVMGQGAMGTVYKAADPVIERVVAIKTINLQLSNEERAEFEERFYREAKSAGRLNHPNIVTIYDVGETEDTAYIAMEYIEGESLREVLDSGVVLPLKRICQIAAHVSSALAYAHENGVVHRDIKPANIMISRRREVKLMDFGIALIPTGSRTQAGTVLGSPKYMAPEQVTGKETDGRADIFSLGVVLYEMLTGTTPFNGDNLSAIMYKILNEEPPRPSALNANVPASCDRIIARALAKRPEDRYQSAKEFYRDLRNYESPEAQDSKQPGPDTATRKASQKPVAGIARRQAAADPLDVKTELLNPPTRRKEAAKAVAPARASGLPRKLVLLALPVLAVAAFVALQATRGIRPIEQAPAAVAETSEVGTPPPLLPEPPPVPSEPPLAASPPPAEAAEPAAAPAVPAAAPPAAQAARMPAPLKAPKPKTVAVAAAPAPAPAAAAEPPVAQPAEAMLAFAITPWGEIYVDGKKAGISPPLTDLKLAPGAHSVEIRNSAFASHHVKVDLDANETVKVKHIFK